MSIICDVIIIFPIYAQFGAICNPDSGGIVCQTYIFKKNNLWSSQKNENSTNKSPSNFPHYCFE